MAQTPTRQLITAVEGLTSSMKRNNSAINFLAKSSAMLGLGTILVQQTDIQQKAVAIGLTYTRLLGENTKAIDSLKIGSIIPLQQTLEFVNQGFKTVEQAMLEVAVKQAMTGQQNESLIKLAKETIRLGGFTRAQTAELISQTYESSRGSKVQSELLMTAMLKLTRAMEIPTFLGAGTGMFKAVGTLAAKIPLFSKSIAEFGNFMMDPAKTATREFLGVQGITNQIIASGDDGVKATELLREALRITGDKFKAFSDPIRGTRHQTLILSNFNKIFGEQGIASSRMTKALNSLSTTIAHHPEKWDATARTQALRFGPVRAAQEVGRELLEATTKNPTAAGTAALIGVAAQSGLLTTALGFNTAAVAANTVGAGVMKKSILASLGVAGVVAGGGIMVHELATHADVKKHGIAGLGGAMNDITAKVADRIGILPKAGFLGARRVGMEEVKRRHEARQAVNKQIEKMDLQIKLTNKQIEVMIKQHLQAMEKLEEISNATKATKSNTEPARKK